MKREGNRGRKREREERRRDSGGVERERAGSIKHA